MTVKAKHLFFLFAALLLITLFFSDLLFYIKPFVELLFEGTSFGKTYMFLFWMTAFFGVLAIKEREKLVFTDRSYFKGFLKIALIGFSVAVLGHIVLFFIFQGILPGVFSIFATMTSQEGVGYWEATTFGHLHFNKISLFLFDYLPFNFATDNGIPFFQVTPNAILISLFILFILVLLLRSALLEGLANYVNRITPKNILWAFASFGIIVTVIDGGPFTVAAQFSFILMAYYIGVYKKKADSLQLLLSLVALLLFLTVLTSFVSQEILIYGPSLAGLTAAVLTLMLFKLPQKQKIYFAALGIAFLIICHTQITAMLFSSHIDKHEEVTLFVYGLPLNENSSALETYLPEKFLSVKLYTHGYIAIIKGIPSSSFNTAYLGSFLKDKFNAKGYLNVVRMNDTYSEYTIHSVREIQKLDECSSEFVEFESRAGLGIAKVRSRLPMHYTALYALNCLLANGIQNPVLSVNGNPYI